MVNGAEVPGRDSVAQGMPLLATKLYIPPLRQGLVPRPRLTNRLSQGLDTRLILISAPAGFGKTTLLSEWRSTPLASKLPFAWVSLDEEDNDPTRFWAYVVAALQRVHPDNMGAEVVAAFHPPQSLAAEAVLPLLINELTTFPRDFILMLDDYHFIATKAIHQSLAFLLEHMPPRMHLVITSRTEPPLPLTLLRGRGQLLELRADDLRFTLAEMTAFLNRVMGLSLTPEQVVALEQRTEGWVAGLQMAALSLQGRDDADAFIQAFSGSHRYVLDYLVEQVLQRQSEDAQKFLLQTSILNRLCGSLCDAVTEQGEGQATLEQLERTNLFLMPLDDERRWYRYHPLFADALRARLQQTQLDLISDLHLRAAQWYNRHDLFEEAISHALATDDLEAATRVIERVYAAVDLIYLSKEMNWLRRLPEPMLRSRPHLCLLFGLGLVFSGRIPAATPWLDEAERLLRAEDEHKTGSIADTQQLWGTLFNAQMVIAAFQSDTARIEPLVQAALAHFPGDERWRLLITAYAGRAYYLGMDLVPAARYLSESLPSLLAQDGPKRLKLLGALGHVQWERGHLHAAAETYQRILRHTVPTAGGRPSAGAIPLYMALGQIHYEWNDLSSAIQHLQQALVIAKDWKMATRIGLAYTELAVVCQAQGDFQRVAWLMQQVEHLADRMAQEEHEHYNIGYLRQRWAQLRLAWGDLEAASRWAQGANFNLEEVEYRRREEYCALARLFIAQGKAEDALNLIERLWRQAKAQEWGRVQLLTLLALIHQALGHNRQAVTRLAEALALAEPEGYIRTFVDEGEPMAALLRTAYRQGLAPPYIAHLLTAFPMATVPTTAVAPPLLDPLSERELDVLRLVAAGLSNPEIAQRLVITLGTVKDHLIHIYRKLDVHSRTQAVARARALNLLSS